MAEEKWLKIPYFAKGSAEALESALTTGRFADGLDKALFYFATDTKQWILVDIDKTIHTITGYNSEEPSEDGSVRRVDTLPSIIDADPKVLYIMDKVVYTFDGHAFYPTYQELQDRIIGVLPENMTVIEYIDNSVQASLDEAKQYADTVGETIKAEAIATANQYTDNMIETATQEVVITVNQYTDTAVSEMKDEAVDDANQYTDEKLALHVVQGGGGE